MYITKPHEFKNYKSHVHSEDEDLREKNMFHARSRSNK